MKRSTKRVLGLLGSMVFLIAALFVYVNYVRSAYGDVQQLRGELAAKKDLYQRQQVIITRVKNLLAQYKSSAELQNTISMALPTDENVSGLLRQLNGISGAVGARLSSFSVGLLPIKANNLGGLQATFQLTGSYGAIKSFLRNIESNVRVMDMTTLRIDPTSAKPNEDRFTATVVVKAYYQK